MAYLDDIMTKPTGELSLWEINYRNKMAPIYMQQQAQKDRASQIQGLIGSKASEQEFIPDTFPGEDPRNLSGSGYSLGSEGAQLAPDAQQAIQQGLLGPGRDASRMATVTPGTGYLGGEISKEELLAKMAGVPGYEDTAIKGLLGGTASKYSGPIQEYKEARELNYIPQNMSYMQYLSIKDKQGDLSMVGPFKDTKEMLASKSQVRKEADKMLAPSRESLRKYKQATDLVNKRKGFANMTGADDTVLMKAFASMILPGEAVMSDDINVIATQGGLPSWFGSYAQKLKGGGTLSLMDRRHIYDTMTTLGKQASIENKEGRDLFSMDIKQGKFNPKAIFRKQIPFSPSEYSKKKDKLNVSEAAPINPEERLKVEKRLEELRRKQGLTP